MLRKVALVCLLFYCGFSTVKISSFNVQVFGLSKMEKPHVVSHLINIFRKYDLIFFQEIRDATGTAIENFVNQLNTGLDESSQYTFVISSRLGRSTSTEQYAYLFKDSKFTLIDTFEFDGTTTRDNGYDYFERPPFSALFSIIEGGNDFKIFLSGLHDSPPDAFNEIQFFINKVFLYYRDKFKWKEKTGTDYKSIVKENTILMGDLNSGCNYLTIAEMTEIKASLAKEELDFLINTDTTVHDGDCPYDRFIATKGIQKYINRKNVKIFNYRTEYSLEESEALEISDHFPIELEIDLYLNATSNNAFLKILLLAFEISFPVLIICFLCVGTIGVWIIIICIVRKKNKDKKKNRIREERTNDDRVEEDYFRTHVKQLTQQLISQKGDSSGISGGREG